MSTRIIPGSSRFTFAVLAAACAALLLAGSAATQTAKKPIKKQGLIDAVKINSLSTRELVKHIERRGVTFEVTPEVEAELRAVGARPEVIEAARANYRPETAAAATPRVTATPPRSTAASATPAAGAVVFAGRGGAEVTRGGGEAAASSGR